MNGRDTVGSATDVHELRGYGDGYYFKAGKGHADRLQVSTNVLHMTPRVADKGEACHKSVGQSARARRLQHKERGFDGGSQ